MPWQSHYSRRESAQSWGEAATTIGLDGEGDGAEGKDGAKGEHCPMSGSDNEKMDADDADGEREDGDGGMKNQEIEPPR